MLAFVNLRIRRVRAIRSVPKNLTNIIITRILRYISRPSSSRLRVAGISVKKTRPVRIMYNTPGITTKRGILLTAINATLPARSKNSFGVGGSGVHNMRSFNVVYTRSRLNVNRSRSNVVILRPRTIPNAPTGSCLGLNDSAIFIVKLAPGEISNTSRVKITHSFSTCLGCGNVKKRVAVPNIRTFRRNRNRSVPMRIPTTSNTPECVNVAVASIGVKPSPR